MNAPLELPELARKIIQQETQKLCAQAEEVRKKTATAAETIEAVCEVLNQRGRYSSITAEHFDRQNYEGILIIDALDEQLARAVRQVLKTFVDRHKKTPDLTILRFVTEKVTGPMKGLPPYPVAYMILGVFHAAITEFGKLASSGAKHPIAAMEHALVHVLLGIVDKYVQTRERPLERHHSDIQREYEVVRRMKCGCGEEKFEVTLQALCHGPAGQPFDRLDLQCKACGARRSISFELPFFRDLERV